jgi:hypothetical protein
MSEKPDRPREYDAVLGGTAPPPVEGVILGGIEGVKSRLASAVVEARIAALKEALKYGDAGLDLLIGALKDDSEQVQRYASLLLRESAGLKGRQALLDYDPWLFFTTLENWKVENFDPKIGITDPVGTAYALRIENWRWEKEEASNLFKILLNDPQASNLQALLCLLTNWGFSSIFVVGALVAAKDQLTSLKAIFVGDEYDNEYKTSSVELSDISPVLGAYPNLEVLQVRGRGYDDDGLAFSPRRHSRLKTLIVETGYMLRRETIDEICALELPALEYLELWLGQDDKVYPHYYYYSEEEDYPIEGSALNNLMPIISGELFPELKYLALRSSDYSDAIAEAIVNSPLLDRLKVLDLSMGTLTDQGAEALLKCPAINRLHTLNVSKNRLSAKMSQRLSKLKCRVISEPQDRDGDRYYFLHE